MSNDPRPPRRVGYRPIVTVFSLHSGSVATWRHYMPLVVPTVPYQCLSARWPIYPVVEGLDEGHLRRNLRGADWSAIAPVGYSPHASTARRVAAYGSASLPTPTR